MASASASNPTLGHLKHVFGSRVTIPARYLDASASAAAAAAPAGVTADGKGVTAKPAAAGSAASWTPL